MRLLLDNLALVMLAFLFVGMLSRHRSEIVLLAVAGIVAVFGLATGEIYVGHILLLPKIVLRDYVADPNVVIIFASLLLFAMIRNLCTHGWPKNALDFVERSIENVTPLQCLLVGPVILVYLSSPRHFEWGYLLIALFVPLAVLLVFGLWRKSVTNTKYTKAITEPEQRSPFGLLARRFSLFVSIIIFLQVFQRINGPHYFLDLILRLEIDARWIVVAIVSAAAISSIFIGWLRALVVVSPLIAPVAVALARSASVFQIGATHWISILIVLALQIMVLVEIHYGRYAFSLKSRSGLERTRYPEVEQRYTALTLGGMLVLFFVWPNLVLWFPDRFLEIWS